MPVCWQEMLREYGSLERKLEEDYVITILSLKELLD